MWQATYNVTLTLRFGISSSKNHSSCHNKIHKSMYVYHHKQIIDHQSEIQSLPAKNKTNLMARVCIFIPSCLFHATNSIIHVPTEVKSRCQSLEWELSSKNEPNVVDHTETHFFLNMLHTELMFTTNRLEWDPYIRCYAYWYFTFSNKF